ncbi:acyl-CoA synthetase [Rhodophyticola sp. CCM32]|uniref:acyl-CoA synthetase n=1 Tax=Rhodophyticola sp. CCM32 TaxID=2916397 RepID=UPI00107F2EC1|nr:acyl-CoA synthetase [Rhodophyticola sp. CCM32]QBX99923.1 acyl-CoA synthetase [Rhodophyticola sp. CCM32]
MQPSSSAVSNIAHFLTKNAARLPDHPAIIWGDQSWTWSELDARVSALAAGMRAELGIGKGARILLQLPNGNEITEVMLAAYRLGAIWVPTNFRQAPGEIAYAAEKSRADVMICDPAYGAHARAAREAAPSLSNVICTGDSDFGLPYEKLIARHMGTHVKNTAVDYHDPCWLFFTSGSTGKPKAVVLTHGQIGFTIVNHSADLMPGTTEQDASLVIAPLSHGAGMHQMVQLATGTASVLMPSGAFDPAVAWQLIEQHQVSNLFSVPTILKMMVEHPAIDQFDHTSLRHVIYAGAPMYREDQSLALQKIGLVLVQYYGLGEVTGAITVLRPQDHVIGDDAPERAGTCGVERMGVEVSIQDEDGTDLPPGTAGEICVKGLSVCCGYLEDDAANAKSFRNGWFLTGDIGYLDENRYLYISGRVSDMYISGGSNVYPREVEEVLLTHPALSEVAIFGIPDEKWGEVGLAVLVTSSGQDVSEETLRAYLQPQLSRYKQPARYLFLDEMPKTAYGKVTKKFLRDVLTERGVL